MTMTLGMVISQAPVLPKGTVNPRTVCGSVYFSRKYDMNSNNKVRLLMGFIGIYFDILKKRTC